MEPSSDDEPTNKPAAPRVLYDNGHDNKVFVGEGLPQAQFTHPQTNGNSNGDAYYVNGGSHTNVNSPNEDMQPTYRVIENSRL